LLLLLLVLLLLMMAVTLTPIALMRLRAGRRCAWLLADRVAKLIAFFAIVVVVAVAVVKLALRGVVRGVRVLPVAWMLLRVWIVRIERLAVAAAATPPPPPASTLAATAAFTVAAAVGLLLLALLLLALLL
jgi:hypothetical protein